MNPPYSSGSLNLFQPTSYGPRRARRPALMDATGEPDAGHMAYGDDDYRYMHPPKEEGDSLHFTPDSLYQPKQYPQMPGAPTRPPSMFSPPDRAGRNKPDAGHMAYGDDDYRYMHPPKEEGDSLHLTPDSLHPPKAYPQMPGATTRPPSMFSPPQKRSLRSQQPQSFSFTPQQDSEAPEQEPEAPQKKPKQLAMPSYEDWYIERMRKKLEIRRLREQLGIKPDISDLLNARNPDLDPDDEIHRPYGKPIPK